MLITLHSNGYEVAVNTRGAELKSFKDPSGKEYVDISGYFLKDDILLTAL